MRYPLFASAAVTLSLACALPAAAQTLPEWHAVADRIIPADDTMRAHIGQLILLPTGELALVSDQDNIVHFLPLTPGMSGSTFGREGEATGEFRNTRWLGTQNGELWVEDVELKRVTYVDSAHNMTHTLREPTTVAMPGSTPEPFVALFTQGMTADNLFVVLALRGMGQQRPDWATPEEWRGTPLLKVTRSGQIVTVLAWIPPNPCEMRIAARIGFTGFETPLCSGSLFRTASDGSTIAVATMDQAAHNYRITSIRMNGDTAFSRVYSYTPIAIPDAAYDSAATVVRTRLASISTPMPEATRPDGYPPLDKLVIGRDGSVWLGEYLTGTTRTWQVLDADGHSIATVQLPGNVDVQVAERGQVWGVARDKDGDRGVVHYTVTAN
ncbi:MAG TPA: hypothetical protein VHW65_10620 [Gemmatimonadales bacterium]|jgi:hypothetical protein|nr:hypothetical protein [Gemmatimonadales bacterium]